MPHLQSLVIVLLRPILVNVTAIVAQQPAPGAPAAARGATNGGGPGQKSAGPEMNGQHPSADVVPELSPEDADAARTREITSKAMTAILLLLFKWLRLSRE